MKRGESHVREFEQRASMCKPPNLTEQQASAQHPSAVPRAKPPTSTTLIPAAMPNLEPPPSSPPQRIAAQQHDHDHDHDHDQRRTVGCTPTTTPPAPLPKHPPSRPHTHTHLQPQPDDLHHEHPRRLDAPGRQPRNSRILHHRHEHASREPNTTLSPTRATSARPVLQKRTRQMRLRNRRSVFLSLPSFPSPSTPG